MNDQDMAKIVQERADELLGEQADDQQLDDEYVKQCLESNEKGDGAMFASLFNGKFLYNTTPKDGQWFRWGGHVWERDDFKTSQKAVDKCALEYLRCASQLRAEIIDEGIESKKDEGGWKIDLMDRYIKRASRLRTENGARKALNWSYIEDNSMACLEEDFDREPWLLPVNNGVICLKTGVLIDGRPEDRLTKKLDIDYCPKADYQPFIEFLEDVCHDEFIQGSEKIPGFLKRVFGYAVTGLSHEQFIFVFLGPGRNGKGVLFNLIADIMGPYYHEIGRGMILEQRNEPTPNAASEHKYALLSKRIIVGAETNKGQKIDASAVKSLTGKNKVNCRPNFGKEINFDPSHTLFLQTNNLPYGLTKEFSLVQRLLLIELPHMYVDDIPSESKKYPAQAHKFRQKDPDLEDKLKKCRQGILRWIVEGCLEWQKEGLNPPECVLSGVEKLAREEDYIGQFISDCMEHRPGDNSIKLPCTAMYDAFLWWWSENQDTTDKRVPAMKTINASLRERGFKVDKIGGRTVIFEMVINVQIVPAVDEYIRSRKGGKS